MLQFRVFNSGMREEFCVIMKLKLQTLAATPARPNRQSHNYTMVNDVISYVTVFAQ